MSEMKEILAKLSAELEEMNGFTRGSFRRFLELYKIESKDEDKALQVNDNPKVSDYLDEFIEKLREQLGNDYVKWGDTWLARPKEGQEMRTMYRYDDYFDMFRETGEPVPWLKIIGNALICWIRENHPEVCVDVEVEGTQGEKPVEEMTTKELIESNSKIKPMSHVDGERLTRLCGCLSYSKGDGYIRLDSVIFTKGNDPKSEVVGRCNADGVIVSHKDYEFKGQVFSDGRYRIVWAAGLLATDVIYVSYDYDHALPTE